MEIDMDSEILFNMSEQVHPLSGSSKFLLKRWTKHTIYSKSGSYNHSTYIKSGSYGWASGSLFLSHSQLIRSNNPIHGTYIRESSPLGIDLYQTQSVYLYDYVIVNDTFFYSNVYTASTVDTTPSLNGDYNGSPINTWNHNIYTFKNTPNAITNNYKWRYNPRASNVVLHDVYGDAPSIYVPPPGDEGYSTLMKSPIYIDNGVYFEIVRGYPRNHFTHKRGLFSLFNIKTVNFTNRSIVSGSYFRNRQTITSTVGTDGLEDGSSPIQSVQVGNLKLVQTDNVINH